MAQTKQESYLKAAWHVLLVGVAVAEMMTAKTNLRRLLLGACAGWHATAIYIDIKDLE